MTRPIGTIPDPRHSGGLQKCEGVPRGVDAPFFDRSGTHVGDPNNDVGYPPGMPFARHSLVHTAYRLDGS